MKRLLIAILLLNISVPSFAGAFVESPFNRALLSKPEPQTYHNPPVPPPPIERIIERQIVMKETKEIVPIYGITLGFVSDYPLIGYCTKDLFIDAGLQNIDGDDSAMILAGGIMQGLPYITLPKFTYPRVGIALNPGATAKPLVGIFCGIERWLDERISVNADVYIWGGNGHYAYPTVSAGAKIVI